jgi:murein DD-endopeptidase MepM/ murein hydrolase activator NlpD
MFSASILMAAALAVSVTPQKLTPGEPLRVMVSDVPEGATVSGRFLDHDLIFLAPPDRGGDRLAFSGVDLDVESGVHRLDVTLRGADGAISTRALELRIEAKEYPLEELEVEPKYVEPPPEVSARIARESAALKALWQTASPEILFDGSVQRPLPGVKGRNFGRRRVFNGEPRSPHSGTDLSAPQGTPVQAAAGGVVALADDHYFSGRIVVLDHGGGIYTAYAHLSQIDVAAGDSVRAGQTIGRVGATGRVTGAHLHWGARAGGARVNPDSLLELLRR